MSEDLKPGVWYRAGATVYRLREVEGKGRRNWSAPGVRALENEVLCRVEGATAEVVAERIHSALTGAFLDVKPNFGTETPEPSLREIVRRYYAPHFSPEEAGRPTEQYCAAVQIWAGPASLTPEA